MAEDNTRSYIFGHLFVALAHLMWAFSTIFWKQIQNVPPFEILSHRILWSFIFLLIFLLFYKRKQIFYLLADRKKRNSLIITGILISINWVTYILAVNTNHIIDASLGYYINPLVSIFLGIIILKERMTPLKIIAIILAFTGVIYLTFDYGKFPWISLVLAFSFGFYGLFKKVYKLNAIDSLMGETLMVAPVALLYIGYLMMNQHSHFLAGSMHDNTYLILAGLITTIPLLFFAEGAMRIPLSNAGFLQYLAPTIMLLIGVLMYGEVFNSSYAVSFSFIWTGLAVYTLSVLKERKKRIRMKKKKVILN